MIKLITPAEQAVAIKSSAYNDPKVAVWWYIDGEIVGSSESYRADEGGGVLDLRGYVQLEIDHMTLWEILVKKTQFAKYAELPYEHFPRGRVIFHVRSRKFYVVTSSQLVHDKAFQTKIRSMYNLPIATRFEVDSHYNPIETADLRYSEAQRDEVADMMKKFMKGGNEDEE